MLPIEYRHLHVAVPTCMPMTGRRHHRRLQNSDYRCVGHLTGTEDGDAELHLLPRVWGPGRAGHLTETEPATYTSCRDGEKRQYQYQFQTEWHERF
jgi:hypothetical protein